MPITKLPIKTRVKLSARWEGMTKIEIRRWLQWSTDPTDAGLRGSAACVLGPFASVLPECFETLIRLSKDEDLDADSYDEGTRCEIVCGLVDDAIRLAAEGPVLAQLFQ